MNKVYTSNEIVLKTEDNYIGKKIKGFKRIDIDECHIIIDDDSVIKLISIWNDDGSSMLDIEFK